MAKEGDVIRLKKKKDSYNLRNEIIKLIIILLIIVAVSFLVYYFFFRIEKCADKECFSRSLVDCKRVEWINDAPEATWVYTILGKQEGKCEINVNLLQIKRGKIDISEAEGKSMNCFFPPGTITTPGQNLELCSGKLKESLQDLIIKKMHSYILENLEDINQEIGNLTKVI